MREGYKMTELGELPEEWEVMRLDDYTDIRLSNVDKKIFKDELSVLLCNYLEVYKNEYITSSMPFMVGSAKRGEIEKFKILKDDVIITKDSEDGNDIAKPAHVSEEIDNLICGYHLALLRPKDDINGLFLSKALQLQNVNIFFQKRANGMTRFGISKHTIQNALIPLPPLPEQHHIAEILSTVDETIEHTEALIEKYRNIKKGLMTDLLTLGIDEEGRIRSEDTHRFKDSPLGRVPEEWEVVDLGDYARMIVPMRDKPKDLSGTIPWTRIEDFEGKYLYGSKSNRGITKETIQKMNLKVYPVNTVLCSCSCSMGVCAITKNELVSNQTFIGIVASKELFYEFLYFLMTFHSDNLQKMSTGTTIDYLSREKFENLQIHFPSLPEQHRITEILTSADERIEEEESYRDKLLQIKKGLMQDLLTGKVRVKVPQEAVA